MGKARTQDYEYVGDTKQEAVVFGGQWINATNLAKVLVRAVFIRR